MCKVWIVSDFGVSVVDESATLPAARLPRKDKDLVTNTKPVKTVAKTWSKKFGPVSPQSSCSNQKFCLSRDAADEKEDHARQRCNEGNDRRRAIDFTSRRRGLKQQMSC